MQFSSIMTHMSAARQAFASTAARSSYISDTKKPLNVIQNVIKSTAARHVFKKDIVQAKRELRETVNEIPSVVWPTIINMSVSLQEHEEKIEIDQRNRYQNLMYRFQHDFF